MNEGGNPLERHYRVSMCARHLFIDFSNDDSSGIV